MMAELVAETAIELLKVRQSAYEDALAQFLAIRRSARPIHAANTMDGSLPTLDDDYATWLDNQKAAIAREIKRIERAQRLSADEFRAKL